MLELEQWNPFLPVQGFAIQRHVLDMMCRVFFYQLSLFLPFHEDCGSKVQTPL